MINCEGREGRLFRPFLLLILYCLRGKTCISCDFYIFAFFKHTIKKQ